MGGRLDLGVHGLRDMEVAPVLEVLLGGREEAVVAHDAEQVLEGELAVGERPLGFLTRLRGSGGHRDWARRCRWRWHEDGG